MEKVNRRITASILVFAVITLSLLPGYLVAHAETGEWSRSVFYVQ